MVEMIWSTSERDPEDDDWPHHDWITHLTVIVAGETWGSGCIWTRRSGFDRRPAYS